MKTIRTLLSGGELFGVGARWAGYAHLDGYEIDPKIAAVARLNGFNVHAADICDVDYSALPLADHLHASTVCTRASQANVGAEETDEDLRMAGAVCRAIRAHQGATFTLENVWAYRTFESFDQIKAALTACGFAVKVQHVNAADYGVPQTRKRLILRAVRGRDRVPPLHPTHRKGGDMFHAPWVGWYAAIADILDTLPETEPAPWQRDRLRKALRATTLIGPGGYDGTVVQVGADLLSFTVPAASNHAQWRAFLLNSENQHSDTTRSGADPTFTIAYGSGTYPRALLIGDQSGSHGNGVQLAAPDQPAMTVRSGRASAAPRAYLLDGDNAGQEWTKGYRAEDEPAMALRASRSAVHRAYTAGRWVRMTVQALGRFQTVPDDYQGLTAQINGNGVPCLLAQRVMESLL